MDLVVFVGNDQGSYGQVNAVINRYEEGGKVIVVKDKNTTFESSREGVKVIDIDCNEGLLELRAVLMEKLRKDVNADFEVALSIASGSGKEHMAIISALLAMPVGIKLIAYTKEGIKFLS